jgi:hypothetical protein
MARRECIENGVGIVRYVDIFRDNYTCRRRFKYREEEDEAEAYFNYLQSLDNQELSIKNQQEIAAQLKRQNDLTEQQLKTKELSNSQDYHRPVMPPIDPEYWEWKREKAEQRAKERAEKEKKEAEEERKRKEYEEQQRLKRIELAQAIENGTISVSPVHKYDLNIIIEENLFVFTNKKAILAIAETISWRSSFAIMIDKYSTVQGIYRSLIDNPSFPTALNYDTIGRIVTANLNDKEFIIEVFSKMDKANCPSRPYSSLDSSTLKLLLSKNLVAAKHLEWVLDLIFWMDNKERIFNGIINDEKDLKFAEKHYYENKSFGFLLALAKKSSNTWIFSSVECDAWKLEKSQTILVFKELLRNTNYKYKGSLAYSMIKILETEEDLREIEPFCGKRDFYIWLDRMQELGFIGKWGRRRESRRRDRRDRRK